MSLLTRRFPTILGLLLLIGAIVGAAIYFQGQAGQSSPDIIPEKVKISNVSDNKFSVSWVSKIPTSGAVEYGSVGEKLGTVIKDERDTSAVAKYLTHHVTIEGLQPNTQYAFRIVVDETARFDNNGSPYLTSTGPVIAGTPPSHNFYGNVVLPSKQSANGAIVYLTLPGGSTSSTVVRESGNYAFTLSTMRSSDLQTYIKFDPSATIANVMVESGGLQSTSSVSLANSAPVPTITLGVNSDFLNAAQEPSIAEVVPGQSPTPTPETPSIFNVEPLAEEGDINVVTTGSVVLLNPKEPGETLTTLRPEFRGTGPAGLTLSIALTGQKAISDTTQIGTDGTWSWAPVIDLRAGRQTITVSYAASGGSTQRIIREFNVDTTGGVTPAFVASPSASVVARASVRPSASASSTATASATPRVAMPDTEEGVPVTGVIENTLLTSAVGIIIMVLGVALLTL